MRLGFKRGLRYLKKCVEGDIGPCEAGEHLADRIKEAADKVKNAAKKVSEVLE